MPLYSSLNNRETKPGLSTRSKPLMIPRLLRSDQIQGRGPPGKQSPCRWAAGPLSKHKRSRSLCPRACPRGRGCGAATALRFSREPPARDRFQRGKSRTPGPRPHGNPRARTRARRAPGRRPPAPRLGPRTPTPRRLTGTALPAAPRVRSPLPRPPSYPPRGRAAALTTTASLSATDPAMFLQRAPGTRRRARVRAGRAHTPARAHAPGWRGRRPGRGRGGVRRGGRGGEGMTVARAAVRRPGVAFKGGRARLGNRGPGTGRGRGPGTAACSACPALRPLDHGWRPGRAVACRREGGWGWGRG